MLARDSRRDEQRSFPVGKVNILTMRPMGFREFLLANGKGMLVDHVEGEYVSGALSDAMLSECLTQYLDYLCVGGMPEAVDCWVREHDMGEVERIHRDIVTSYEGDFIKHAPPSMVRSTASGMTSPCSYPKKPGVSYSGMLYQEHVPQISTKQFNGLWMPDWSIRWMW